MTQHYVPTFEQFCRGLCDLFRELDKFGIHNSKELNERWELIKAKRALDESGK